MVRTRKSDPCVPGPSSGCVLKIEQIASSIVDQKALAGDLEGRGLSKFAQANHIPQAVFETLHGTLRKHYSTSASSPSNYSLLNQCGQREPDRVAPDPETRLKLGFNGETLTYRIFACSNVPQQFNSDVLVPASARCILIHAQ